MVLRGGGTGTRGRDAGERICRTGGECVARRSRVKFRVACEVTDMAFDLCVSRHGIVCVLVRDRLDHAVAA